MSQVGERREGGRRRLGTGRVIWRDGGTGIGWGRPYIEVGERLGEGKEKLILTVGYVLEYERLYEEGMGGQIGGDVYDPIWFTQYP